MAQEMMTFRDFAILCPNLLRAGIVI